MDRVLATSLECTKFMLQPNMSCAQAVFRFLVHTWSDYCFWLWIPMPSLFNCSLITLRYRFARFPLPVWLLSLFIAFLFATLAGSCFWGFFYVFTSTTITHKVSATFQSNVSKIFCSAFHHGHHRCDTDPRGHKPSGHNRTATDCLRKQACHALAADPSSNVRKDYSFF